MVRFYVSQCRFYCYELSSALTGLSEALSTILCVAYGMVARTVVKDSSCI